MHDTSFSTRVAKFKTGSKHFKDASRPASGATNIKKPYKSTKLTERRKIYH